MKYTLEELARRTGRRRRNWLEEGEGTAEELAIWPIWPEETLAGIRSWYLLLLQPWLEQIVPARTGS
jgi:hypothetical protein